MKVAPPALYRRPPSITARTLGAPYADVSFCELRSETLGARPDPFDLRQSRLLSPLAPRPRLLSVPRIPENTRVLILLTILGDWAHHRDARLL